MFKIYVGNLSFETSEDALRELFSQHGQVQSVNIVTDRATGRSRGFGFVEMADEDAGKAAIEELNGQSFEGRTLRVNEARQRPRQAESGSRR
jgi:RNA recognition motif-containing protein